MSRMENQGAHAVDAAKSELPQKTYGFTDRDFDVQWRATWGNRAAERQAINAKRS